MPEHIHNQHFNKNETVTLDSIPHILGNGVVWLDSKDSVYKRYRMHDGVLILQYWDGAQFKDV